MRTRSWVLALVLVVPAATSACSSAEPDVPLPTWDGPAGDTVRLLSVEGTLVVDADGCLRLETDTVPAVLTPVWPDGTDAERDGASIVVDPEGDGPRLEVGQRTRLAGGFGDEHKDVRCGGHDDAPAFEVDQVVTAR